MCDWLTVFDAINAWWTPGRLFTAYLFYSCAVQGLPDPLVGGSRFYLWLYRTLHLIAANVGLARKQPEMPKVEYK